MSGMGGSLGGVSPAEEMIRVAQDDDGRLVRAPVYAPLPPE
jgi:hypothetical protein